MSLPFRPSLRPFLQILSAHMQFTQQVLINAETEAWESVLSAAYSCWAIAPECLGFF